MVVLLGSEVISDSTSVNATRLIETGDDEYDRKVRDTDIINIPEEYYRDINR